MDERLRFVAKLLDGESMTEVCREFGISRKTGYKIFQRYKDSGVEALSDRWRRPVRYANQLPSQIESLIVTPEARETSLGCSQDPRVAGPSIGRGRPDPRQEHHPCGFTSPRPGQGNRSPSSTGPRNAAIRRHCPQRSVVRRLRRRVQARQWSLLLPADRDRPASRFLLLCEALDSTREDTAITAFE